MWAGDEVSPKLYKIGCLKPFTILPLIQSHFKWTLSIPVILLGLSLLYDPGINLTSPSMPPKTPEWDWVKPSIFLKKKGFYSKPYCFVSG